MALYFNVSKKIISNAASSNGPGACLLESYKHYFSNIFSFLEYCASMDIQTALSLTRKSVHIYTIIPIYCNECHSGIKSQTIVQFRKDPKKGRPRTLLWPQVQLFIVLFLHLEPTLSLWHTQCSHSNTFVTYKWFHYATVSECTLSPFLVKNIYHSRLFFTLMEQKLGLFIVLNC